MWLVPRHLSAETSLGSPPVICLRRLPQLAMSTLEEKEKFLALQLIPSKEISALGPHCGFDSFIHTVS